VFEICPTTHLPSFVPASPTVAQVHTPVEILTVFRYTLQDRTLELQLLSGVLVMTDRQQRDSSVHLFMFTKPCRKGDLYAATMSICLSVCLSRDFETLLVCVLASRTTGVPEVYSP